MAVTRIHDTFWGSGTVAVTIEFMIRASTHEQPSDQLSFLDKGTENREHA